jgi:hypothetical protein
MRISRTILSAGARNVALVSMTLGAAASLCSAEPITYYVSQTIGNVGITGNIVTDGTIGVLAQADIIGWNLLMTDTRVSVPVDLSCCVNSSFFGFSGSDLSAMPTQLRFNFSGTDRGGFEISNGSLDYDWYLSSGSGGNGAGEGLIFYYAVAVFDGPFMSLSGTVAFGDAANTAALIDFQGGASSAPVLLPGGQSVAEVTGTIGGLGTQDYYSFLWTGGAFSATASVTGTPNAGGSYLFSEGAAGSCSSGGTATLSSSDSFTNTIGIANLPAGEYCIGIDANNANDPAFALTFNTPVSGVPEPSLLVLLSIGLGTISVVRRHKRR